jgi:hypothetical protein
MFDDSVAYVTAFGFTISVPELNLMAGILPVKAVARMQSISFPLLTSIHTDPSKVSPWHPLAPHLLKEVRLRYLV